MLFNPVRGTYDKTAPPLLLDEDLLRKTFMNFDEDHDKVLSKDEIKKAFKSLGSRVSGLRAFRGISRADKDGDGSIDMDELDELVKYAVKVGFYVK